MTENKFDIIHIEENYNTEILNKKSIYNFEYYLRNTRPLYEYNSFTKKICGKYLNLNSPISDLLHTKVSELTTSHSNIPYQFINELKIEYVPNIKQCFINEYYTSSKLNDDILNVVPYNNWRVKDIWNRYGYGDNTKICVIDTGFKTHINDHFISLVDDNPRNDLESHGSRIYNIIKHPIEKYKSGLSTKSSILGCKSYNSGYNTYILICIAMIIGLLEKCNLFLISLECRRGRFLENILNNYYNDVHFIMPSGNNYEEISNEILQSHKHILVFGRTNYKNIFNNDCRYGNNIKGSLCGIYPEYINNKYHNLYGTSYSAAYMTSYLSILYSCKPKNVSLLLNRCLGNNNIININKLFEL